MQPGDIIEWFHNSRNDIVDIDEKFHSTTMNDWVPISGKSLLISITDVEMTWFHFDTVRIFHARVDDVRNGPSFYPGNMCSPRKVSDLS